MSFRLRKESIIFCKTQQEVADIVGVQIWVMKYHFTRKKKISTVINGYLIEKL